MHIHPMKRTIFEKSTTSLQLWFYAIYLIASTRCGISARQLGREPGDLQDRARMFKKICTEPMNGDVFTNTIEGSFGNLKTGMRGAYEHISPRYLQSYLDKFSWRYNRRMRDEPMFELLLARAAHSR